mmetsp:Transcript_24633/g.77213  ORF Transcript_24633/g.77213 Transcript_24633/m.77213 type:complete len:228 (+) Transcript_24633:1432-2115(+)
MRFQRRSLPMTVAKSALSTLAKSASKASLYSDTNAWCRLERFPALAGKNLRCTRAMELRSVAGAGAFPATVVSCAALSSMVCMAPSSSSSGSGRNCTMISSSTASISAPRMGWLRRRKDMSSSESVADDISDSDFGRRCRTCASAATLVPTGTSTFLPLMSTPTIVFVVSCVAALVQLAGISFGSLLCGVELPLPGADLGLSPAFSRACLSMRCTSLRSRRKARSVE